MVIQTIEREKALHKDLFTNKKKQSQLSRHNHYMKFIFFDTISITNLDHTNNIFVGFVEGLISGYMQYIDLLLLQERRSVKIEVNKLKKI